MKDSIPCCSVTVFILIRSETSCLNIDTTNYQRFQCKLRTIRKKIWVGLTQIWEKLLVSIFVPFLLFADRSVNPHIKKRMITDQIDNIICDGKEQ